MTLGSWACPFTKTCNHLLLTQLRAAWAQYRGCRIVIELQYLQLSSRQNYVRQLDFPLCFCPNCTSF